MELNYHGVKLRSHIESDVDDEIRWFTTETEWAKSDAPWEPLEPIDENGIREYILGWVGFEPILYSRLEIEYDGVHLGWCSAYFIDENCEWSALDDVVTKNIFAAVGIDICEPAYWGKGIGTKALAAFIDYYISNGHTELFTQTWSGNKAMIRCAEKLGFEEYRRFEGIREVGGEKFDALTFKLNLDKFEHFKETLI